jgi:hypothetical protein
MLLVKPQEFAIVNKRAVICLAVIPALVAVSAFSITRWWYGRGPRIEVFDTIDLGLQEPGSSLRVELNIRNAGGRPLELKNFQSSCNCMLLEWRNEDQPDSSKLEAATVFPEEELKTFASLTIPGGASHAFRGTLEFETNDLERPFVKIEFLARVEGRILAFPAALNFQSVQDGRIVKRTVEVRDTGRSTPCRISRAETNNTEQVKMKLTQLGSEPADPKNPLLGKSIAKLDVEIRPPTNSGRLESNVFLFENGNAQPILTIPITGAILPRVLVTPSTIVLPRTTGDGVVYEATCLCRSTEKKPVQLSLEKAPNGMAVTFLDDTKKSAMKLIKVSWPPTEGKASHGQASEQIRLRATIGEQVENVEIRVIRRAKP